MTEDDTFNALRRPGVAQMLRHYEEWVQNGGASHFEGLEAMCQRHGWTWNEFSRKGALYREELKEQEALRLAQNKL